MHKPRRVDGVPRRCVPAPSYGHWASGHMNVHDSRFRLPGVRLSQCQPAEGSRTCSPRRQSYLPQDVTEMGSNRKWALGSGFSHLEKCTEGWSVLCEGQRGPSCPMNDPTTGTWCLLEAPDFFPRFHPYRGRASSSPGQVH